MKEGTTVCCPIPNGLPTRASVKEFQTEVEGRKFLPGVARSVHIASQGGLRSTRALGLCYIDEVVFDLSDRPTLQDGPIPRFYWPCLAETVTCAARRPQPKENPK
jgi:hypothetical protein